MFVAFKVVVVFFASGTIAGIFSLPMIDTSVGQKIGPKKLFLILFIVILVLMLGLMFTSEG